MLSCEILSGKRCITNAHLALQANFSAWRTLFTFGYADPIYDKPSFKFAQELYAHLLTGMPIGEAAQKTRAAFVKPAEDRKPVGDPTRLAYTVFADPLATVREESSSLR
jgi:hypothetical protein